MQGNEDMGSTLCLSQNQVDNLPWIRPHADHRYILNLREEDNFSTKDKTVEFILSPMCLSSIDITVQLDTSL